MKKLLTFIMCSMLVLATACSAKPATNAEPSPEPTESPVPTESPEPAASDPASEEQSDWPEGWPSTAPLAYGEIELPQLMDTKDGEQIAIMKTNYGDITLRFFPEDAPKAVENFITHAKDGYYNGVIFHRVVPGFVIQGGDPTGTGTGGESIFGSPFETEITPKLHHIRGALSMANSGPNTNGSQFFIVQNNSLDEQTKANVEDMKKNIDHVVNQDADGKFVTVGDVFPTAILDKYISDGGAPMLDDPFGNYSVFGQVIDGFDVVDAIAAVELVEQEEKPGEGKPVKDVVIESIDITTYKK